eukprot:GHUV01013157.1.p1 GENE.GHUV01013157.1~~GHUV01013157.1.p1  ORF type:complete len:745 (+),score=296.48 GHUV01013157.1:610-2844(+)
MLSSHAVFALLQELLEFVAHYHMLLDPINLVTCLYRLAKMSKEASRSRAGYLSELQKHPTFQLLLRSISSKFLQGHLNFLHTHSEGLKGVDGRCLANLTWALAKLDLSNDDSALTTELALTVAPFIIRSLDSSSPQGLANMLWSYAKLPVAPPAVVNALVAKITDQLVLQSQRPDRASTFDAQALSNSIWALAHLKSRGMEVDALRNPALMRFMNELAAAAAHALARPHATLTPPGTNSEVRLPEAQRYLALVEREFSCQALVNIAWSFATLLGVACTQQPSIHQLFLLIHSESLVRLRCTALALSSGQNLPYVGGGGFNEQALSNAVYAFDKVGLLSSELLSAVFEVSALRLQRGSASHHPDLASFKPQELCTLLKACHANIAPPWVFLGSLLQLLSTHPAMADSWTAQERLELHRACQLYLVHQTEGNAAGTGPGGVGLAAVAALANSLASSVGVSMSSGPPSNGRISNTGSTLTPTALSSSLFSSQAGRLSNTGGSGPPSGSLGGLLANLVGASASPRTSFTSGTGLGAGGPSSTGGEPITSTYGQLPPVQAQQAALNLQQQLHQQQQRTRVASGSAAANNAALLQLLLQQQLQQQQVVNCPICGVMLRQQDALGHVEACITANRNAAQLEALLRQQQQQAVASWAVQQQAAQQAVQSQQLQLLAAQLQQQQQQQNLLAAAQQVAAAQQQQRQAAAVGGGGLGLEDLCRAAGAVDAAALAPWMMEAAAASRPPLRPSQRRL